MKRVFAVAAQLLVFALAAYAQSDRGRLLGVIYDTSGAIVPNATVTVTNLATEASRQVQADARGQYRFDNLLPASYRISASADGFADGFVPDVILSVGSERT